MKYYKVILLYERGMNYQFIFQTDSEKEAIKAALEPPDVQETNQKYNLVDVQVEVMDQLPIPAKDRLWMERRDDGVYVILDDERRMAATFLFGQYYKTVQLTNYKGEDMPQSLKKTDFLLDVEMWLQTYYPTMLGSKPGEDEEDT